MRSIVTVAFVMSGEHKTRKFKFFAKSIYYFKFVENPFFFCVLRLYVELTHSFISFHCDLIFANFLQNYSVLVSFLLCLLILHIDSVHSPILANIKMICRLCIGNWATRLHTGIRSRGGRLSMRQIAMYTLGNA